MTLWHRVLSMLVVSLAVALPASSFAADAEGAVLVVDRLGHVTLADLDGGKPVVVLATLPIGTRVRLQQASTLTLLYVASGDAYAVTGPGVAQVDTLGVSVTDGASVRQRPLNASLPVRLRSDSLAMSGVVMRNAALRARHPAGLLTVVPSHLAWASVPRDAHYHVEMRDAAGTVLFEQSAQGSTLAFPTGVQLLPDGLYTWTVSREVAHGVPLSSSASFSLAPQDLRDEAQRGRPGATSAFADRIVYAIWLEQIGALGEARQMWQALADERPDDDVLLARARR